MNQISSGSGMSEPRDPLATQRAAGVSLGFNVVSTGAKLVAAVLTGSVSLFSEATHSATDVVASIIAYISIRAAAVPPDDDHPYGHGKIESLAGFGEAVLLLVIVVYVVIEAIHRLITGSELHQAEIGMVVMGISSFGSFMVGKYVGKVGKAYGSPALISNGQHLTIDFWTSIGVLAALATSHFTGWQQADAVFAIGLAAWIGVGSWRLTQEAYHQLIDRRLPDEELAQVKEILDSEDELLSYHRLRTRHSGTTHYVDVHVVVPIDMTLVDAHALADRVEKRIRVALAPAQVVLHVDPYDPMKANRSPSPIL